MMMNDDMSNFEEILKFHDDMAKGLETLRNLTEDDIATDQLDKEEVLIIGKMKLIHYKPLVEAAKIKKIPLMITYALINRQTIQPIYHPED